MWHALWLAVVMAAWFVALAALVLGVCTLAAGIARPHRSRGERSFGGGVR